MRVLGLLVRGGQLIVTEESLQFADDEVWCRIDGPVPLAGEDYQFGLGEAPLR